MDAVLSFFHTPFGGVITSASEFDCGANSPGLQLDGLDENPSASERDSTTNSLLENDKVTRRYCTPERNARKAIPIPEAAKSCRPCRKSELDSILTLTRKSPG